MCFVWTGASSSPITLATLRYSASLQAAAFNVNWPNNAFLAGGSSTSVDLVAPIAHGFPRSHAPRRVTSFLGRDHRAITEKACVFTVFTYLELF